MPIKYRKIKGYKYQLLEDYQIKTEITGRLCRYYRDHFLKITKAGYLTILKGYAWDGTSGPTPDWPEKHVMRASLVHDALYQLLKKKVIDKAWRKYADYLFKEILIADGMWKWRAAYYHWAVRKFGKFCV